jgi:uncharacterized protein with PIN domain
MDKYGVETDTSKEVKTAEEDASKCPICNTPLENPEETGQKKCPVHGTAPFEK